jgi:hypothetical protein
LNDSSAFHEYVWDGILSRDSRRIVQTFLSLDEQSKETVLAHLKRMTSESGWHPEQVKSAQTALDAILNKGQV